MLLCEEERRINSCSSEMQGMGEGRDHRQVGLMEKGSRGQIKGFERKGKGPLRIIPVRSPETHLDFGSWGTGAELYFPRMRNIAPFLFFIILKGRQIFRSRFAYG